MFFLNTDREQARTLGTLNCMQSHILPKSDSSMASVQTIVIIHPLFHSQLYAIPNDALPSTFPAFPKDAERRLRVESESNLARFYDKIEEASAILKASSIAPEVRKLVPTERSLYVMQEFRFSFTVDVPPCCFPTCTITSARPTRSTVSAVVC